MPRRDGVQMTTPRRGVLRFESLMLRTILAHMTMSVASDRGAVLEQASSSHRDPKGVRVFLYDAENDDRQLGLDEIALDELGEDQLLWIDVSSLDSVSTATARLGLTSATLAYLAGAPTRPTLFFDDSYFHLVVIVAQETPLGYEALALHLIVGENWILTVHRGRTDVLEPFDERIRGDSPLGRLDAPALLATFLHEHVASYLRESEPFEVELDSLDLQVMMGRVDDATVFKQLVGLRRRLGRLRRLLAPHREVYGLLARPDFELLSGSDSMETFASLTERTEQALQQLETTREMIVSSFEIYTTWTAHGTNKVMKLLTVSSVALLPPTLLASTMGMNSLPHGLTSPVAFLITTIAMVGLVVTVLSFARLRGWL
jgi:Mg2+ and Co2+ transporter CorA